YEEFEHHPTSTFAFQVVRQMMQARCLPLIESLLTFRVVAHQNLAESRVESFDMRREVLAVLKVELFLPALFGWTRRRETVCRRITQNSGTKLFVNQDPRLLLWNSGIDSGLEAVVDHLLRVRYFLRLLGSQRFVPPEHLHLK